MRSTSLALIATALLLTTFYSANATQIEVRAASAMGDKAALVVDGTVSTVRAIWNNDRTRIYTEVMVSPATTYKGDAGASVRVLQIGGVVDNVRMTVDGAPLWTPGEEVLLFLERVPQSSAFQVSGLSQGKLDVLRDPNTGERYVIPSVSLSSAPTSVGATARLPIQKFVQSALGELQPSK